MNTVEREAKLRKICMGSGRLQEKCLQVKAQHRTKIAKRILQSKRSENRQLPLKKEKKKRKERQRKGCYF